MQFALRPRVFRRNAEPDRVRGLPMIEGLEPLPLKEEGPGDFFAERQREVRATPLARRPPRPRR